MELIIDISPQVEVNIASEALLILLNNIISNAFKHTEFGTITIAFQQSTLSIIDTGEGIAPPLQQRIFDDGVKSAGSQGLGMGLSIVKRLCERYAVEYAIKSSPHGTEFTLLFEQP